MNCHKETLLLHCCCGPCGARMVARLRPDFSVVALWYNPNVYPHAEHDRRFDAFTQFAMRMSVPVLEARLMDRVVPTERGMSALSEDRCVRCYEQRLAYTAGVCARHAVRFFSTTMLSSVYQKVSIIRSIGERLGDTYGVTFVCGEYWRTYYETRSAVRSLGLYSQKYCGCVPSARERAIALAES